MPWSTRLLRLLLRAYPREFRERFGADLEADFAELLAPAAAARRGPTPARTSGARCR